MSATPVPTCGRRCRRHLQPAGQRPSPEHADEGPRAGHGVACEGGERLSHPAPRRRVANWDGGAWDGGASRSRSPMPRAGSDLGGRGTTTNGGTVGSGTGGPGPLSRSDGWTHERGRINGGLMRNLQMNTRQAGVVLISPYVFNNSKTSPALHQKKNITSINLKKEKTSPALTARSYHRSWNRLVFVRPCESATIA